jgi:hypothetical protein
MVLDRTCTIFTKLGVESGNESRNSNLCFFSLFEKGCGRPRPIHVLRKLTWISFLDGSNWYFALVQQCFPLLWDFYLQTTKSLILLIFYIFYMKNVLYHWCTKAKDQFEPSRREIHTSIHPQILRRPIKATQFIQLRYNWN